jgi:hypothetical protein
MGARYLYAFIFASILAFFLVFARAEAQQLESGDIVIIVSDAKSHLLLSHADVFLLGGDQPLSSLTDARGKLVFQDLAPGTYRISVVRDGYNRYDVDAFDLSPHGRVTIAVAMSPTIKTIASVTVRPSVSISSEDLNGTSAQRKISGTLADALNKLAGVSVSDYDTNGQSAFNISLNNHDASQTAISVDGIRIVGPSSGLVAASQNLFSGASVSFTPTAGSIAGSVNFQTLRPTKLWTYDVKNALGNYGAQIFSASASGTKGRLGIALQHVHTSKDAFLSGLVYQDQSGQSYLHLAGNSASGDLIKLAYTVNNRTSIAFSGLFAKTNYDTICTAFTTLLPCGYGPNTQSSAHNSQVSVSVNALVGNVSASVSLFSPFGNNTYNAPQRTLNGTLSPYASWASFAANGGFASASVTARRHTATLGLFSSQFRSTISHNYSGTIVSAAQPAQQFRNFSLSNKVEANQRLAITHTFSLQSATNTGTALTLSEAADWLIGKHDELQGTLSVGSAQPVYGEKVPIADALSAQYDCYNGSVYVNGPSDDAVRQSSTSYNLSWRHSYGAGYITVNAYRQNSFGQSLLSAVPVYAEPDDMFTDGRMAFLGDVQNVWSSPAVCNSMPFNPARVYISKSVSGLGQINQGFTISGRVALGRNLLLFPMYALGSTYLSSLNSQLQYPGSYYGVGLQLPHRPLRTAGVTVDGTVPKSSFEWLLNAQFTSINNTQNLPPYTLYNAGIVLQTQRGSITLLESNIFGTRTGLFSTYQGINPMPVIGGGTFAFATQPLPPRQWQITWDIPWHQKLPSAP